MDSIPVASQIKSFVQFVARDKEGAKKTQENFSRRCIVVSQVRSAVEAILGDKNAAKMTQLEFVDELNGMVNGIPVIGHAKGVVHYALRDRQGGDDAMKSASRSTGVLVGGVGGAMAGGVVGGPLGLPIGAVSGGIAGGAAMDGITTGVETAVRKKFCPSGIVHVGREIKRDPKNAGLYVDAVGMVALDGVSGYGAVKIATPMAAAEVPVYAIALDESINGILNPSPLKLVKKKTKIQTRDLSVPPKIEEKVETLIDVIETVEAHKDAHKKSHVNNANNLYPTLCLHEELSEVAEVERANVENESLLKRSFSTADPEADPKLCDQNNLMVLKMIHEEEPVYVMLRINSMDPSPEKNDPNGNMLNSESGLEFEVTDVEVEQIKNNGSKTNDEDDINQNSIIKQDNEIDIEDVKKISNSEFYV